MIDVGLKTLKDIREQGWSTREEDTGLVNAVFFEIKQEAIKWVKSCRCTKNRACPSCYRFIIFHNITEEDLKDEI